MSKNLFDYATKELSQDAFLRWLLENFDDPVVGNASIKLIQNMAALFPDQPIDVSKIVKVETHAQLHKIDVVADITLVNGDIYTFVIEDKTYSKDHDNQLEKYNEYINKFKSKSIYRIYYKTDFLYKGEVEHINSAGGWKIFDMERIKETFEEFKDSSNDVLSYYSKYCLKRYEEMNTVSSNNLKDWTVKEWDAWIHKEFIPLINEEFDNQIEIYVWKYKGLKYSIGAYYPHCLSNGTNKPLIEFMFKNSDMITANLHVETESANYSWSNEYRTEEFKNKFNELYSAGLLPSFKAKECKRSFGCLKKNIEKDNLDSIAKRMIYIISEFYEFFSKFN